MTIFNLPDFHPNEHPVPSKNRIVSLQASLKKKSTKTSTGENSSTEVSSGVYTSQSKESMVIWMDLSPCTIVTNTIRLHSTTTK
jgi:hypothetical protein